MRRKRERERITVNNLMNERNEEEGMGERIKESNLLRTRGFSGILCYLRRIGSLKKKSIIKNGNQSCVSLSVEPLRPDKQWTVTKRIFDIM